jgi:hypothetical protein
MGWYGYGIYDGDGTQTLHYDFIKWSKCCVDDDIICDWLTDTGTKIPFDKLKSFKKGIPLVLKRMPKIKKYWLDDDAIVWQMLLSLFIDNKIPIPKIIKENGKSATKFLMGEHAEDFTNVSARRKRLNSFLKKI